MGVALALSVGVGRMRGRLRDCSTMALLVGMLALQGCAVEWMREYPLYCRMQEQARVRDTLYFGLSVPGGGEVGDADWKRFEADVLGRAFPHGFTVLASHGAWRGADGETVTEPGRVVVVLHEEDATSESAIRETIERYRSAFHQEAVLRERGIVCVSL